ncbi:glutamate 5-kinase [Tsuneonella mangrovi]|uniref:glutamate 5-kinase n=1 Tax=Tsuneonella mangrovi TaxID=1982042 RepID=UPI000BA1CCE4|nr:glutamate 5-kinase [Tsuneonella mangrovi]
MPVTNLTDLLDPARCARLVIKVGSALLVGKDGGVRRNWLAGLVEEIAAARATGQEVVVVSSGAIALGAARLSLARGGRASLADAQAAAAVGQIALSGLWAELLAERGLAAAQMLVTLDDLEDRRRYLNASATLVHLLERGVVPVVNENDSVATAEIRFGDNDRLAARVAQAARADGVVLLSDVDGLYDRDPREHGATLVPLVEKIDARIKAMAGESSTSGMGSGGMTSKIQAAEIATRAGIALAIVNGTSDKPLASALQSGRSSVFVPRRNDAGRKAWIGGRIAVKGALRVDDGCRAALGKGASVLAAGITMVDGQFRRGDLVTIAAADGSALAQGLAEYDADECRTIAGHKATEQAELLGYAPRAAVVHRDHMVLL